MRENGVRAGELREAARPGLAAGLGLEGGWWRKGPGSDLRLVCAASSWRARPSLTGHCSNPPQPREAFSDPSRRGIHPALCCPLWAFRCIHMVPVTLLRPQSAEADALSKALCLCHLLPSIVGGESIVSGVCTKYLLWILSFSLYKTCRREEVPAALFHR